MREGELVSKRVAGGRERGRAKEKGVGLKMVDMLMCLVWIGT